MRCRCQAPALRAPRRRWERAPQRSAACPCPDLTAVPACFSYRREGCTMPSASPLPLSRSCKGSFWFLTSFFPPIGSFFGTVMGIKKPVPQSVLLGQVNFRILRCHPAWCIPPTHAYIHMRNFVDGGFTPAPILCKAFPVALGSPFIKALRAAISPPATLWKEVSFYYLLFFIGLVHYSTREGNPSSVFSLSFFV